MESDGLAGASPITRRRLLGLVAAAGGGLVLARDGLAAPLPAACQGLQGGRISWLVGWTPGGGYDMYSRLLEPSVERILGAEVVVENVPGAAGVVAARRISSARPNGRTLGILNGSGLMLAPYTNPAFAPDLERDFTVLARVIRHHQTLVVGPGLGARNIAELVRIGRRRPLVLGATGPTTVNVILAAALGPLFGIDVRLVLGFPGTQELLTAILRNDLDGSVMGDESAQPYDELLPILRFSASEEGATMARGQTLVGPTGLTVTAPELFPSPEQARLDAQALTGLLEVGRLLAAPPGLPDELSTCLQASALAAVEDPDFRERAALAGRSVEPAPARDVERHVRSARAALPRFADLVRQIVKGASG